MTNKGSANAVVLLFIVGIINLSGILRAQNDIIFNRLSLDNGLSNSYVTCIFQDSKGFMWIGTAVKKYTKEIAKKINAFSSSTKTKKSIFVTFITSYGLVNNQYSSQYVQNELTMDHLFVDV